MATIFSDSFESGDTSAWDNTYGTVTVDNGNALVGSYGASVNPSGDNIVQLFDIGNYSRFRARFYFDPSAVTFGSAFGGVKIIQGKNGSDVQSFFIYLRDNNGPKALTASVRNDSGGENGTGFHGISNAPHWLEIDYKQATTAGANDGYLTVWLDNNQIFNITGVDNDTKNVDFIQFGSLEVFGSPGGELVFDAFVSDDTNFIGEAITGGSATITAQGNIKATKQQTISAKANIYGELSLNQNNFKFRNDNGTEATATQLAAENTNIERGKNTNTRLRIQVFAQGNPDVRAFQLEYRKVGDTGWQKIE